MKLSKIDVNYLFTLYKMRCLTIHQSYTFFYSSEYESIQAFYQEKVIPLIKAKFVNIKQGTRSGYSLEITQQSLSFLQEHLQIPTEIYDITTGKVVKGMLKAKDVEIEPRYIDHQVELNQFSLEFQHYYKKYNFTTPIQYFDEKYLSQMTHIRPDGLIRVGKLDLFLEQDMSTENTKQLQDKWSRYRRYLTYEFDQQGDRRIVVCFIVKCRQGDIEKRKELIRKTISNSFDTLLSNHFDIYIGSKIEILRMLFKKVLVGQRELTQEFGKILMSHNYSLNDGSKLKVKLDGSEYHYYINKTDSQGRLGYIGPSEGRRGRFMEFLGDEYKYSPVSVLSKIAFHERNSHNFDIAYSKVANMRLIGYIVLLDDIHEMFTHLNTMGLVETNNVYFTTLDRLKQKPFHEALFSYQHNGDIYCCTNEYFEPIKYEGNLESYNKNGLLKNDNKTA